MSKKKVAVILSGCGVYDGSEIHEATLTMLAIARAGGEYTIFAPDMEQHHVINHLTGEEMPEKRNVLVEAARIARRKIQSLSDYQARDFDALMLPGGFGAAKNLCTFAFDGPDCNVHPEVERAIRETNAAGKPIGALCIAPVILAKVLGQGKITIGSDPETAKAITTLGGTHVVTTHAVVVTDEQLKIATTPCYMLDATIDQIAQGAENVVKAVFSMIKD